MDKTVVPRRNTNASNLSNTPFVVCRTKASVIVIHSLYSVYTSTKYYAVSKLSSNMNKKDLIE